MSISEINLFRFRIFCFAGRAMRRSGPPLALAVVIFSLIPAGGCRRAGRPGSGMHSAASKKTAPPRTIVTAAGVEMVLIPGGTFTMGSGRGDEDEKPVHTVRLNAFYMDKTEVTQREYEALMKANPSRWKGPELPVEQVDWRHAILYCNMRSRKEGFTPCYDPRTGACDFGADGYRLPTEAEWEYACRAGAETAYFFGDDPRRLGAYAWYADNSGKQTHPAGTRKPNPWGLFDMLGNVAEWCNDFYAEDAYADSAPENPRGPRTGDERVLRGGGWKTGADRCRCAARSSETPRFADACFGSDAIGFRCVRPARAENRAMKQ